MAPAREAPFSDHAIDVHQTPAERAISALEVVSHVTVWPVGRFAHAHTRLAHAPYEVAPWRIP